MSVETQLKTLSSHRRNERIVTTSECKLNDDGSMFKRIISFVTLAYFSLTILFTNRRTEVHSKSWNLWSNTTKRVRFGMALTTILICVWVVFFPHPYNLAVGVAIAYMPAIVIATLIDKERFELQEPRRSDINRVNVAIPYIFISGALLVRSAADYQTADDFGFLKLTIPVGITIALVIWVVLKKASLPLTLAITLIYAIPFVLQLNDWGPSTGELIINGTIVRKYTSTRPLRQSIVIHFNNEEKSVYVGRVAYQRFKVGDQACAKERKGWLGVVTRFPTSCR